MHPLHPVPSLFTFPSCFLVFSSFSSPSFLYLSCRPTAPTLFSFLLPDQHYCTETTAPSVIDEQRLMQSPTLRQTKPRTSALSGTPTLPEPIIWGIPKVKCSKALQRRKRGATKTTLREHISISASLHASPCTPPPPLHPSSVHSLRDGFTSCPRSQALRHR